MNLTGLWQPWGQLSIIAPELWEYPALILHVLVVFLLLIGRWQDVRGIRGRRIGLLLGLLVSVVIANSVLVPRYPASHSLPPPNLPEEPLAPFAPLLGAAPVAFAACTLGPGPALLVGFVSGFSRSLLTRVLILEPFYFAFWGYLAGLLLWQEVEGRFCEILRQPLVALPLTTLVLLPLQPVAGLVHTLSSGLSALDYAFSLVRLSVGPYITQSLTAGILLQLVYYFEPHLRPVLLADRPSPFAVSLNRRALSMVVPVSAALTCVAFYLVTAGLIRTARETAIGEMRRTATTAAEGIPYFIQSSQGLLTAFAAGQSLQGLSPDALNAALQADVRAVAFFDQLMFFESQRQLLAAYPPLAVGGSHLTGEEEMLLERVLATGATQIGAVQRDDSGSPFIAFLVPVEHEANGESISGVLLGRARVDVNPILARVLANLQSTRVGGEGFVVDDEGRIVVHPNADAILLEWGDRGDAWDAGAEDGVFERRNPLTNVRELVVTAPVAGYPWTVVLTLPYEVVLYDALRAAWPLLLIQLALSCSVILLAPMLVLPLVRRLRELDDVATRMAEGDLTAPVAFEGRDEFAGLSGALEELRESISDLHADRDFVLNLSSEISRTADTPEGLERILRRLVHDTRARVARLVLASSSNAETVITSEGEPWDGTEEIDRALMNLLQSAEPGLLVVPRVAEYELLDSRKMAPDAPSSLAAHPVWIGGQMSGVMWIGYDSDHEFTAGEMSVLINLATYIRVAIENQRLGASLRAGERELTASLAAISEAVIGIDSEGRINLVNPAAESVLGLDAGRSLGRRFERVGLPSSVSALFKESSRTAGVLDRELWLEDGRRLQARISSVLSELGEQAGCVVALRDVTQIVGSREMRTRFVETFSDHLRTPLTLLQGYATMIPLIGKLSVRQHEYVEKIAAAAIQIKGLVDDLLHLNALESDEGLRKVRIELGDLLVGAVDAARPEAELKEITLRLEPAERMAVVSGNPQLIERAIGNLLDNAIKYTPAGGMVTVTLRVVDGHAVVQVSDTGIGVSKEDQRRLLERFFRVDRPEVMAVPGAGLGLALVKSIVDWHRGKLWVDSEPGRGSAFSVGIPLEPPRSAERGSSDEGPDIDVSGASGSAG